MLIPVSTALAAIGAHALHPEIKEHILFRTGYVPLSALTNATIRDMAAHLNALKLKHKPAHTVQGPLEKRWIPVLSNFIESELKLTRSLWAEAVKNLRKLMSSVYYHFPSPRHPEWPDQDSPPGIRRLSPSNCCTTSVISSVCTSTLPAITHIYHKPITAAL